MNFKILNLLLITAFILVGCSHGSFTERKAPCPQTAYTGKNPCNPLPINVACPLLKKTEHTS